MSNICVCLIPTKKIPEIGQLSVKNNWILGRHVVPGPFGQFPQRNDDCDNSEIPMTEFLPAKMEGFGCFGTFLDLLN